MRNSENNKQSSLVRLFLAYLFVSMLVISAVTFLGSYWLSYNKSHTELQARLDKQFNEMVELLKGPLWDFNNREVVIIGRLYLKNEYASFVNIESSEGDVVYSEGVRDDNPMFTRTSIIHYRDTTVGRVSYSVSEKYLDDLQSGFLWSYFVSTITIMLFTLFVFGILLHSVFEKSFQAFISAVHDFSKGNKAAFDVNAPYIELKPLITALRKMARDRAYAEKIKREAVELKERVISASPIGILVYDETGQCIAANESAATIIGATREQVLQQNFHDIAAWKKSGLYDCAVSAIRENAVQHMEIDFETTFDKAVSLDCLYVPISVGNKSHLLLMVSDIGERRKNEEELSSYRHQLEKLVKDRTQELHDAQDELLRKQRLATLGQLTATVSHELRNPLGSMKSSLYILKKSCDVDNQQIERGLELLDRNIDRCDHIIDELLGFTRSVEIKRHPVLVDQWLESVVDEQDFPDGISVIKDFSLLSLEELLDAERLRRAVINVMENACHAMLDDDRQLRDKENSRLQIRTCKRDQRIEIIITDTGSGISADVLEKIFEPLFSTKGFGVGLGMPTVKQIMEQHEGGVRIDSVVGEGTSVTLWLPCLVEKSAKSF